MKAGRLWAYGGVSVGAVTSVAANVAHSYVAPAGAPTDWQPEGGLILAAAFWPIALMIAVEVLIRSEWPSGRLSQGLRYGGVTLVAAVAAVVSYQHMSGLLRHYRETDTAVLIGPLAIDGLMLVCTAALLTAKDRSALPDSSHESDPIRSATDQPAQPAPAPNPDPTGSTPVTPPGVEAPVGPGPTYSIRSSRPRSGGRRLPRSMRRRSDRPAESAPAPDPIVDTDRIAALIEDIWTRSDRRRSVPDRAPRRPAASKSDRVDDDLRLELTRLIDAKKLPPQPTAEAIRTSLRIAPDKARQLREERKALQDQDARDGNKEPEVARG